MGGARSSFGRVRQVPVCSSSPRPHTRLDFLVVIQRGALVIHIQRTCYADHGATGRDGDTLPAALCEIVHEVSSIPEQALTRAR
jgi:hypothetical protein